jgi:Core-2/I-Branching enzyme
MTTLPTLHQLLVQEGRSIAAQSSPACDPKLRHCCHFWPASRGGGARFSTHFRHCLASTPHLLFLQTPKGGTVPPPAKHAELTYLQERYFYRYFWTPRRSWALLSPNMQRIAAAGLQRAVHAFPSGNVVRVQRRTRGFSPAIAFRARHHPFAPTRPCRKGADWFVLSRPVFEGLQARTRAAPELVRYFRRTYIPTESFFHTVLLPTWESQNAGTNLHHRRFSGGPHPDVLTEDDFAELRTSGQFFARKFDSSSAGLLNRIDRKLLSS